MTLLHYRIVNVFGVRGQTFSGNPLCVFEDARGLDDSTMQALARQFNLSETTFLLPSERADARVRIFMPHVELPFAGHPTLGSAHVLTSLHDLQGELRLELNTGIISVVRRAERWSLEAPPARTRPAHVEKGELALLLGVEAGEVLAAEWVDTGSEQLIVQLSAASAVQRCAPVHARLQPLAPNDPAYAVVYVWAQTAADRASARCFFTQGSAVCEDPATGSACANLGGHLAGRARLPLELTVTQGEQIQRPSELALHVDTRGRSHVAGRVLELGRGSIELS